MVKEDCPWKSLVCENNYKKKVYSNENLVIDKILSISVYELKNSSVSFPNINQQYQHCWQK